MASGADRKPFWLLVAAVVLVDRVTKVAAEATLVHGPVDVIGDFLRFTLLYNPGAAFGMHLGPYSRWIFAVIAIVAVIILRRMSGEAPASDRLRQLSVGVVAGGAAGNLIDRFVSAPGVVDFIDVGIGMSRFPTFNVADIAVSCGAVALAISLWREDVAARAVSDQ